MVIPGLRGMSLKDFFKRLYREFEEDAVTDSSAQLAFYFIFALFPFLFFIVMLSAYLPVRDAAQQLLDRASYLMPEDAYVLIQQHLDTLLYQTRPKLLTVGALVTLWSSSRGLDALRKAMNLAYDVKESRPFLRTQTVALGMTMAGASVVLLAVGAFVAGSHLGFQAAELFEMGTEFLVFWSYLRWPFTASLIMTLLALSYYFLPDVKQEFKFITPGSVLGTFMWLLGTWGFSQYVSLFGKYNATYGSLGGVMVLLLWLYVGGLVIITGAEINAIIEHASSDGKTKGARVAGEAPAPLLERPSASPPGDAKSAAVAKRTRFRWWKRAHPDG
ncbi:MAG: YihY/virulence factor BrkB family protein [Myxococcaceae bacterium]